MFRLRDHLRRLETSANCSTCVFRTRSTSSETACHETLAVNGLDESYLRPIAYYGYGELGVHTRGNDVDVAILTFPWGAYLGEEGQQNGCRAMISSWQRVGPNTIPHTAKATGIYLNSMLAVHEAQRAGYDEAILLTQDGYVADGSGENVFMIKDGVIFTRTCPHRSCPASRGRRSSRSLARSATRSTRSG